MNTSLLTKPLGSDSAPVLGMTVRQLLADLRNLLNGSLQGSTFTIVASGTATLPATVRDVAVTGAGTTVNLPAVGSVADGHRIAIKCEVATPNCTVAGDIDNLAGTTHVITKDYGAVTFRKRGSYWWILYSEISWGIS